MSSPLNNRSIGVFDSGLGGLSCVKELRRLLPKEDILYLGDTGRVPYGSRSRETIRRYAADDLAFVESMGVKMIVAACATVSSSVDEELLSGLSVPFMGVIEAAAAKAAAVTKGHVGVIGTSATIRSGAFPREIGFINPNAKVQSVACPLFVPIVENGFFAGDNPIAHAAAEHYLKELAEVDTLILGCTHYPLLAGVIGRVLPDATLVDSGAETARAAAMFLEKQGLLKENGAGTLRCFVSDSVESFSANASLFLGSNLSFTTEYVSLESLGSF